MVALRPCVCVLASLTALRSSAALPVESGCDAGDNVLLVQRGLTARQGDLHVGSEVLASLSPSQEALLRKVHHTVTQMPDLPGNVSMEDMMVVAQKILSTFQNESFVNSLHWGIGNMTEAWAVFMSLSEAAAVKLDANCTSTDGAILDLKTYWTTIEAGISVFFGKMIGGFVELVQRNPYEMKTIQDAVAPLFTTGNSSASNASATEAMSGSMANMTNTIKGDLVQYQSGYLFSNKSEVCSKFQSIWPNISTMPAMYEKGAAFLEESAKNLASMEGLIVAFAPDVSDRVMGVLNHSLQASMNITATGGPVAKLTVAALKAELERCLDCKMPSPEEGGAPRGGPNVLVGLAVAVAAWLAIRH